MYQANFNMAQGYYGIPACGMTSGMECGGRQQNSTFRGSPRKPRKPAMAPAASWKNNIGKLSTGTEEDDKDVTVVIGNLPKLLCSDKGLEVALDAAQVLPLVRLFAVEQIEDSGEATVILKGEEAALIVIKHFRGLSCGKPTRWSRGITTRYSAEAGRKLRLIKEGQQDTEETKPEKETATALSESKAKVEPASNVVPLVLTRTNLKMRWADVEDDRDSDYEEEGDTNSTVASTVTGAKDFYTATEESSTGLVSSAVDPDEAESSNLDDFLACQ
jgi:hypothetical protein